MARKVLIAFGVVFAILLVVILTRPSTIVVERRLAISAPRDLVFSYLDDFHGWVQWSVWEKLDPAMKRSFEGPPSGVGASYAWSGNDAIGEGRLTITEDVPNERVKMNAEYVRPFKVSYPVTLETATVGDATLVTLRMEVTNGFVGKAMSVVMDADKAIGGDFDKSLAELKFLAEAEAARRAAEKAAPPPEPAPSPEPDAGSAAPADAGR